LYEHSQTAGKEIHAGPSRPFVMNLFSLSEQTTSKDLKVKAGKGSPAEA